MSPAEIATKDDVARVLDRLDALERRLAAVTMQARDEWLSVSEAAAQCGVSESTIRRRIAAGDLQAKGSGKMRRVRL
jgi:excisionase family DNA binding protein